MKTELKKISPDQYDSIVEEAAGAIRDGKIVAIPTETVYGLAMNRDSAEGMKRLVCLKNRPPDKPFTLHLADRNELLKYASEVSPITKKLTARYWPGPLTVIVPSIFKEPLGLRVPGHQLTRDIIGASKVPVVLPSANPAGLEPAHTAEQVLDYFDGQIDMVVDDGETTLGDPSTVVKIAESGLSILRTGIISEEDIYSTACVNILFICTGNTCRSPMAEGILKKLLADRLGIDASDLPTHGYLVHSAGVSAMGGDKASRNAFMALQKWHIDISGHRTQPVTLHALGQADRIFVMTLGHKTVLEQAGGPFVDRIELLDQKGKDIIDPFGGSESVYSRCASQIYSNLVEILEKL